MSLKKQLLSRLALRIYLVGLLQIVVVAGGFLLLVQIVRERYTDPVSLEDRFVEETVRPLVDDPQALLAAIEAARDTVEARITVIDPHGAILASTAPADAPPCEHRGRHPPPRGGPPRDGAPRGPREGWSRPPDGPPPQEDGPGRGPRDEVEVGAIDWWPISSRAPKRSANLCRSASLRFADGSFGRVEFRRDTYPTAPGVPGLAVVGLVLVVAFVGSWILVRSIGRPLQKLAATARAFGAGSFEARAEIARRDEIGEVAGAFDEMAGRVSDLVRGEKELIANVSHELRTPLARIRVAVDIASEGNADVAKASLVDIAEDLDELERLISDVLTAARLDLGKSTSSRGIPPLRRERVDITEMLARAEARFRTAHPDRPLTLEVAEALPDVDGDPVLLRRVIDNLLENAHKYTETPDAPIVLRATSAQGVAIEVVDRGIGIAPADLSGVFRPFFRVDRSRTRETGGLGLGLALAKRIVEAHGGTITLFSQPTEGTRAIVRLPAAPAQGER